MQGTQGVVNRERNNVNSNGYVSSKLCFEIPPTHGMSESYYNVSYGLLHGTLPPFSLHEGCTLIQFWLC